MNIIENSNFTCDTETGHCLSNETILQDEDRLDTSHIESKPKLIYYYDALCGWCYGFSPVIAKLYKEYKNRVDIELISGGLFLEARIGYINDVAPYIKAGAYKNVELTTGVKFGREFLSTIFGDGNIVLNSLPPSIALCIVKEKFPERQLEFGEMLLNAIYFDGLSADDINGFAQYASKIGFDKKEFIDKMENIKYKIEAEKEFEFFKSSPFNGMPTLVLESEGNKIPLSNGYSSFDKLSLKLEHLLDKC